MASTPATTPLDGDGGEGRGPDDLALQQLAQQRILLKSILGSSIFS